jgi:2,3-bisphosphoglycerate-dependent phosphoglycerate mutase
MVGRLILVRHGESEWNEANLFTGWTDVDLTGKGEAEARAAGGRLRDAGIVPTLAHTSVLRRSIRTLWLALQALERTWLPERKTWRLNERHYGALQGLNKAETAERVGADQVHAWRRGYAVRPPSLEPDDERNPAMEPRYAAVPRNELPLTESLADTLARVLPYWRTEAAPALHAGETLLIAAHGNSQRALVKHLEGLSDAAVEGLEIPKAVPWVYTFDERFRLLDRRELD